MRRPAEETVSYGFVLFPSFPMMAFASLVEPLRAANLVLGRRAYDWRLVSTSFEPVPASNGFSLTPTDLVADRPDCRRIVLCSGGDADRLSAPAVVAWIRERLLRGGEIGAVADAAFFLAAHGLLDGYRCTLHWTSQPAFAEAFPDVALERSLYVIDRNRFTSLGGVGALDMQLALIARDHDAATAGAVADWFVHSPLRAPEERRPLPLSIRSGVRDRMVLACIADMEAATEAPLSVRDLAHRRGASVDTLERAFRAELGETPGRFQRRLRLRRARDLLAHSDMSVGEVALACGYADRSAFSRAFRAAFGVHPKLARRAT